MAIPKWYEYRVIRSQADNAILVRGRSGCVITYISLLGFGPFGLESAKCLFTSASRQERQCGQNWLMIPIPLKI